MKVTLVCPNCQHQWTVDLELLRQLYLDLSKQPQGASLLLPCINCHTYFFPQNLIAFFKNLEIKQDTPLPSTVGYFLEIAEEAIQWGDVKTALDFYEKGLNYAKLEKDTAGQEDILHAMGYLLMTQKDFQRAYLVYEQALKLAQQNNDLETQAICLHQMGHCYLRGERFPEALLLYKQSLQLKEKLNIQKGQSYTFSQMGEIYQKQGEFELAKTHFLKALTMATMHEAPDTEALNMVRLGHLAVEQGDQTSAKTWYRQALKLLRQYNLLDAAENVQQYYFSILTLEEKIEATLEHLAQKTTYMAMEYLMALPNTQSFPDEIFTLSQELESDERLGIQRYDLVIFLRAVVHYLNTKKWLSVPAGYEGYMTEIENYANSQTS